MVMDRAGYRVAKRRKCTQHVGPQHKVTKDDCIKWCAPRSSDKSESGNFALSLSLFSYPCRPPQDPLRPLQGTHPSVVVYVMHIIAGDSMQHVAS